MVKLSASVGADGDNRPHDVAMVQYLLMRALPPAGKGSTVGSYWSETEPTGRLDGVASDDFLYWLSAFEWDVTSNDLWAEPEPPEGYTVKMANGHLFEILLARVRAQDKNVRLLSGTHHLYLKFKGIPGKPQLQIGRHMLKVPRSRYAVPMAFDRMLPDGWGAGLKEDIDGMRATNKLPITLAAVTLTPDGFWQAHFVQKQIIWLTPRGHMGGLSVPAEVKPVMAERLAAALDGWGNPVWGTTGEGVQMLTLTSTMKDPMFEGVGTKAGHTAMKEQGGGWRLFNEMRIHSHSDFDVRAVVEACAVALTRDDQTLSKSDEQNILRAIRYLRYVGATHWQKSLTEALANFGKDMRFEHREGYRTLVFVEGEVSFYRGFGAGINATYMIDVNNGNEYVMISPEIGVGLDGGITGSLGVMFAKMSELEGISYVLAGALYFAEGSVEFSPDLKIEQGQGALGSEIYPNAEWKELLDRDYGGKLTASYSFLWQVDLLSDEMAETLVGWIGDL